MLINKTERYIEIMPQIRALLAADPDLPIAALANTTAILKNTFNWLWVGFYMVNSAQTELQLSVFQGPVACTRIAKGRGVCGQSWIQNQIMIIPDVHAHHDHIACSSLSKSEIVVPLYHRTGNIIGVLDIDDAQLSSFDDTDAQFLQQICALITEYVDFQTT